MTVEGFNTNLRQDEMRRFMVSLFLLIMVATFLFFPEMAHAEWSGKFGPTSDLKTNTTDSLKEWWKTVAGWGLYLSLAGLLFSIFFAGGKWWWVPVCVFLLCLFGEKTVTQVASWAEFNTAATGSPGT
ncbi:hypothetical protein [Pseudomonas baetica]|uniref:hypothetical protein n=1 Tax=Pseudomonas baetica TaxID=674054 RepID=UPI002404C908|nr:hypothetical protein [Pseudomonas baetica]MDF9778805.1 protein-S-isoprenylcysteine O-methyltransferase Ste14 [Pseudomonas baetica]